MTRSLGHGDHNRVFYGPWTPQGLGTAAPPGGTPAPAHPWGRNWRVPWCPKASEARRVVVTTATLRPAHSCPATQAGNQNRPGPPGLPGPQLPQAEAAGQVTPCPQLPGLLCGGGPARRPGQRGQTSQAWPPMDVAQAEPPPGASPHSHPALARAGTRGCSLPVPGSAPQVFKCSVGAAAGPPQQPPLTALVCLGPEGWEGPGQLQGTWWRRSGQVWEALPPWCSVGIWGAQRI